ncbi:unnamed protein product [Ostreobium quekettii]|uniref:Coatomer subunit zeta n=1 Tax=Ostreobium quekettii TaxID=121088 RepID=A0A8S1J0V3_9CHLO|nr:unnamed protein product [Ostreobium quekettii]|eukprot:evm.model.scf_361.6 EVM.evm.TU.scf_361.6   scf_361:43772-46473(-)
MATVDPTCMVVKALALLDSDGKRIVVKYYTPEWSTVTQQAEFEKSLFSKTCKTNARGEAEIILFDDLVVVYKSLGDLTFYVTGSQSENELVLCGVLQAFYESVTLLLRSAVEKKTALENLDQVLLVMDEIVDNGLILEMDPQTVAARVGMRSGDGAEVPFAEQTFSQAFARAKEHLALGNWTMQK